MLQCSEFMLRKNSGGADGIRTRDLVTASHARSQLRHSPFLVCRSPQRKYNFYIGLIERCQGKRTAKTARRRRISLGRVIEAIWTFVSGLSFGGVREGDFGGRQ